MSARAGSAALVLLACMAACPAMAGGGPKVPAYQEFPGERTVADAITAYGEPTLARIKPFFRWAGVDYPPKQAVLLASKQDKRIELWAKAEGEYRFIRTYFVLEASGRAGPKLQEGDEQVPEGFYKIIGLNPNSAYHLSMKLNYPNALDVEHARREGRRWPGSDIFIHGKAVSRGCLAIGNDSIEELFVLAENMGMGNIAVVIAPHDPRKWPLHAGARHKPWVRTLYQEIEREFAGFPRDRFKTPVQARETTARSVADTR